MLSSELSLVFCYVYTIRSLINQDIYVRFTKNLSYRLAKHNSDLNRSAKAFAPWELIYYEAHRKEEDARRREKYLKTTAGSRAIKCMFRKELAEVNDLNKRKVYY